MIRASRFVAPGRLAIAAAAGFVLVTAAYKTGLMRTIDDDVAAAVRTAQAGALTAVASFDDVVFRPTAMFGVAAVLLVWLLWRGPAWSWMGPLGIGIAAAIDFGFKAGWSVFLHPRQLIEAAQIVVGLHFHGLSPYPSGHVERAAFIAVIALAFLPRWISLPFLALAATTPYARMYSEAHKLSDVFGGIELGVFTAALTLWLITKMPWIETRIRTSWLDWRGGSAARRQAPREATDEGHARA